MNKMLHSSGIKNKSKNERNSGVFFDVLSMISRDSKYIISSQRQPMAESFNSTQSHKEIVRIQNKRRIQYSSSFYM